MKVGVYFKDKPRTGQLKEEIDCSHAKLDSHGCCIHNEECSDEAVSMNDGWGYERLYCRQRSNQTAEKE